MPASIKIAVYTNGDDAFVAWAPSEFILAAAVPAGARAQNSHGAQVETVENRVGFKKDKPKSGDHRPSSEWPFQRFNWTDHAVDVGNNVRYRVTAMIDDGSGRPSRRASRAMDPLGDAGDRRWRRLLVLLQSRPGAVAIRRALPEGKKLTPAKFKAQLKKSVDPKFRAFLEGDLGTQSSRSCRTRSRQRRAARRALRARRREARKGADRARRRLHLILANGSDKSGDGNASARSS